jgi:hypothetical protein
MFSLLDNLPYEIIYIIQSYLDPLSQSKLKQINQYFNNTIIIQISRKEEKRKKRINRLRYFNPYFDFLQKYYDKIIKEENEKEYVQAFNSKCITWDILTDKKYNNLYNMPDNYNLTKHPNVGWNIIKEYAFKCYKENNNYYNDNIYYDKYYVCGQEKNPNITFDIIINNIPEYFYNWDRISENKNITTEILMKYPDKPWNYIKLSENKNITIDYIANNTDKDWSWFRITKRAKLEDIQKYPNLPWNYAELSSNKDITWDMIKSNLQIPWYPRNVGFNPNITLEIVKANPQYKWDYDSLNSAGVLTFEEVKKYIAQIDPIFIGYGKGITLEDIDNNPNFPWNWWSGISNNPNLTREFFEKHLDKDWNYTSVLNILYGKCYKKSY